MRLMSAALTAGWVIPYLTNEYEMGIAACAAVRHSSGNWAPAQVFDVGAILSNVASEMIESDDVELHDTAEISAMRASPVNAKVTSFILTANEVCGLVQYSSLRAVE